MYKTIILPLVLWGGELGRSNKEEYGLRVFEKWMLGENMCT
jgi:hypothetical protein